MTRLENGELLMLYLSQKGTELQEIIGKRNELKEPEMKKWFKEFLEKQEEILRVYIHDTGPYPEDKNTYLLPFRFALMWALQDWRPFLKKNVTSSEPNSWLVVFVARGGMILAEDLESFIDSHVWTYYKPQAHPKEFDDPDVFRIYTDRLFEDKVIEFAPENGFNVLFVEDVVDTGDNLEETYEYVSEILDNNDITLNRAATVSLFTRMPTLEDMPIYGILFGAENIQLDRAWGNDYEDGLDRRDFKELKEYIDEHNR